MLQARRTIGARVLGQVQIWCMGDRGWPVQMDDGEGRQEVGDQGVRRAGPQGEEGKVSLGEAFGQL